MTHHRAFSSRIFLMGREQQQENKQEECEKTLVISLQVEMKKLKRFQVEMKKKIIRVMFSE